MPVSPTGLDPTDGPRIYYSTTTSKRHERIKRKWNRLVRMNPARVVDVLRFGTLEASNSWGDTLQDFFPLMDVLVGISDDQDPCWNALVPAGIIDALCQSCIHASVACQAEPEYEQTAAIDCTLGIMVNFTNRFSNPLTRTDMIILSSIKRSWPLLINHIWSHPELSVGPDRALARELLGLITADLVAQDPSVLSIVDDVNDHTVPTLARCLRYSTSPSDLYYNAEYRAVHHAPAYIHDLIMKGAQGYYSGLLAALVHPLTTLPMHVVLAGTILLYALQKVADLTTQAGLAFTRALSHDASLWRSLWKVASMKDTQLDQVMLAYVVKSANCALELNPSGDEALKAEQRVQLVKAWLQSGFIDTMDNMLPYWSIRNVLAFEVMYMLGNFYEVIRRNMMKDASFLPLLRKEMPRPRLLRAFLDIAAMEPKDYPGATERVIMLHRGLGELTWRTWYSLEAVSRVNRQCMRRNCPKRGRARCKDCKSTVYCGIECQFSDWREHRVICGFRDHELENTALLQLISREDVSEQVKRDASNGKHIAGQLKLRDKGDRDGMPPPGKDAIHPERLPFRFHRYEQKTDLPLPYPGQS